MSAPAPPPAPSRLFISYAHADAELVVRLAEALHAGGQAVFLDRWELQPGDSLVDRLFDDGLARSDGVVLVLSARSVASRWVREELNAAVVRRVEDRIRVIPVVVDGVEVPLALRSLVQVDLRRGFDEGVRAILDIAHGIRERPPVAPLAPHLRDMPAPAEGLSPLATRVAAALLAAVDADSGFEQPVAGADLAAATALAPVELGDGVGELEEAGLVDVERFVGAGPGEFAWARATHRLFERLADRLPYQPMTDVASVVQALAAAGDLDGESARLRTGLSHGRLNRAVEHLEAAGAVEVERWGGTRPYAFGHLWATRRTRQMAAELGG